MRYLLVVYSAVKPKTQWMSIMLVVLTVHIDVYVLHELNWHETQWRLDFVAHSGTILPFVPLLLWEHIQVQQNVQTWCLRQMSSTETNFWHSVTGMSLVCTGYINKQESCAIAKMTTWCTDKSKQTATPPPKMTWLSVDSIQSDVMDVGVVEQTFSPPNFTTFPWE